MGLGERFVRLRGRMLLSMAAVPMLFFGTVLGAVPAQATGSFSQASLQSDVNGLQAAGNTGVVAQVIDHAGAGRCGKAGQQPARTI